VSVIVRQVWGGRPGRAGASAEESKEKEVRLMGSVWADTAVSLSHAGHAPLRLGLRFGG